MINKTGMTVKQLIEDEAVPILSDEDMERIERANELLNDKKTCPALDWCQRHIKGKGVEK